MAGSDRTSPSTGGDADPASDAPVDLRVALARDEATVRRLAAIIETTPDAVIGTDVVGHIDLWNRGAEQLFGYRADEIVGQYAQVLFTLATDENAGEFRAAVAAGGTRTPLTAPVRRKDGSVLEVSVAASPTYDDQGELTGFAITARDITEELRTHSLLARSEARFRQIIETTTEGFWAIDGSGTTILVNAAMAAMLGYRVDEMAGRPFTDFLVPAERDEIQQLFRARADLGNGHYDVCLQHRDGSVLDVRVAYSALVDDEVGEAGVLSVITDVTEARRNERRLQMQARILDSIHEAVVATDPDGVVQYVNPAARELLVWADDFDPIGLPVVELARTPAGVEAVNGILDHLRTHAEWSAEFTFQLPGRPPTPWLIQASAIGTGRDDAVIVALVIDLTERQAAEQRAREHAAQQATVARLGRFSMADRPLPELCEEAVEEVRSVLGDADTRVFIARDGAALVTLDDAVHAFPSLGPPWTPRITDLVGQRSALEQFRAGESVRVLAAERAPAPQGGPPGGIVAVGITDGTEVFGVLVVAVPPDHPVTDEDNNFLQAVAAVLGAAFARQRTARTLVEVEETERQRLAEALHDDPLQVMTAAALRLELFSRMRALPEQRDTIDDLVRDIRLAATRMRNLMFDLSPDDVADVGLAEVLGQVLEHASADCGFTYEIIDHVDGLVDEATTMVLFRTAQEAIVNIRKHAHADRVVVELESTPTGTRVVVADDGAGFDVAQSERRTGHLGLRSMRNRVQRAGGTWSVSSTPGVGSRVEFFVPDPPGPVRGAR